MRKTQTPIANGLTAEKRWQSQQMQNQNGIQRLRLVWLQTDGPTPTPK
jgi:hypothetical protein